MSHFCMYTQLFPKMDSVSPPLESWLDFVLPTLCQFWAQPLRVLVASLFSHLNYHVRLCLS